MPSSYTQSLRLILPVTGELTGTWGDAVNAGLTELVEDAIAGTAAIAMANANVTLTTANEAVDQARNMFLNLTGANTAQRDIIVPAVSKLYFVHNGTTGGFGVRVKTAAGSGVVVPNGQRMALYCDGTDVLFAFGSSVGRDVLLAADAAAARTTLDVPSRGGGNATGTWDISISGNAATVTNGVYAVGTQTIAGAKTFSDSITLSAPRLYQDNSAIGFEMGPGSWTGDTSKMGFVVAATKSLALYGHGGAHGVEIGPSGVMFYGTVTLPTTSVLNVTANSGANSVGMPGFLYNASGATHNPGDVVAGSGLRFSAGDGTNTGAALSGTWRCMGYATSAKATLYVRVT